MPRKLPYSGKQKKQQLQERKARKKDGPKYLADWSDEDKDDENEAPTPVGGKKEFVQGGATKQAPCDSDVQKMNKQPETDRKSKVSVNNFRLHFLKEADEVLNCRKKEARRPIQQLDEKDLEYSTEEAYPQHVNLDFPHRPAWSYNISKQQLEKQEKEYFQAYLSEMISQPSCQDLSYFELNLENWRQLWRVVEMADILVLIADIRYPALHVPPSLLHFLHHTLHKPVILLLNKTDMVPPSMAVAWRHYLLRQFPHTLRDVICFSSSGGHNRRRHGNSGGDGVGGETEKKDDTEDAKEEDDDDGKCKEVDKDEDVPLDFDPSKAMFKKPSKGSTLPLGPAQLYQAVSKIVQDKVDLAGWRQQLEQQGIWESEDSLHHPLDNRGGGGGGGDGGGDGESPSQSSRDQRYKDGVVTLGFIGYPNVGKSSVLNALKGQKVVSISQTPGHTKHLQTHFLSPHIPVKLCDCPGLVFPSLVPKPLQVIAGIFPVSQVREPYSVVQYIAQRIHLPGLLKLRPLPDWIDDDDQKTKKEMEMDYRWSAFDICEAWAIKCGFFTPKASRPDLYRAANNILRLAVSGRIRVCFRPPGYCGTVEDWRSHPDTHSLHRRLKARVQKQRRQRRCERSEVLGEVGGGGTAVRGGGDREYDDDEYDDVYDDDDEEGVETNDEGNEDVLKNQ